MTKQYATRPRLEPVVQHTTEPTTRAPSYPERPIAFRRYPVGWWVCDTRLETIGRVTWCGIDLITIKIPGGAEYQRSLLDVVSCTARQAAGLDGVHPA